MTETFTIELLDSARHRRYEFDCGTAALNDFLHFRARREMAAGTSVCYVVVPPQDPGLVAGYYTLSTATIARDELPDTLTKKLPPYSELPAILLGRLARDIRFKGKCLGACLMMSVMRRAVASSHEIASWAIIADPKDEGAKVFYRGFGFQALNADRLFITTRQAAQFISNK